MKSNLPLRTAKFVLKMMTFGMKNDCFKDNSFVWKRSIYQNCLNLDKYCNPVMIQYLNLIFRMILHNRASHFSLRLAHKFYFILFVHR